MKRERKKSRMVLLAVILLFSVSLISAIPVTTARTIYVPDDYAKIQWAVNKANPGDTIIIRDGFYTENVIVNRPLTIRSENGSENCIVKAENSLFHTFQVIAGHVNIYQLSVGGAIAAGAPWPAGIHLLKVEHCNILNNRVFHNNDGIELDFSSNNTIKNNILRFNRENGIELDFSSNNLIENNTCAECRGQLILHASLNNTLINNTMSDYHHRCIFGVFGLELSHFIHDIDASNKINGKPVCYWIDKQNQQVPDDAGYVGIVNSKNITVKELTLNNNLQGVLLVNSTKSSIDTVNMSANNLGIDMYFSSNNNIKNNNILNSSYHGIVLRKSLNNKIHRNSVIKNHRDGITLSQSQNNNIYLNNFSANGRCGIVLRSSSNSNIYLNNFINNTLNVYSEESTNNWNSTKPINYTYNGRTYRNYLGNYWDDYTGSDADGDGIGDTPYIVDPDNKDYYPLMEPQENYIIPPTVIYVPDNYAKIQWAVENASYGDTIIIRDGLYVENVNVTKSLTIRSENGSANCTVKAADTAYHTIQVIADYVNIYGFNVTGSTTMLPYWPAGIYLQGAKHCNILNNNVSDSWDGIEIEGTEFDFCSHTTIKNNNVSLCCENGIEIDPYSNNNLVDNNTVSKSKILLFLYASSNNTLTNNTMSDPETLRPIDRHNCTFGVYGDEISHFIHSIDTSNEVNGKPIYYWVGKQNQQVPCDAGYVGIVNSKNITVKGLTLANNSEGVLLVNSTDSIIDTVNTLDGYVGFNVLYSSNNIIKNNTASNITSGIIHSESSNNSIYLNNFSANDRHGITLRNSSNNNIYLNDLIANTRNGFLLRESSNNNIYLNNFSANDWHGITLRESSNNNIYLNNFINNTDNVYSIGSTNNWNSTSKITYIYNGSQYTNYLGNYWDDYSGSDADGDGIGDIPYIIDSDNEDYYPLMEPWENYN